jgi:hypothetical protein
MNTKIKKIMYRCDLCNKEFQMDLMYMKVNIFQGMELQYAENIVTKVIGMVGHPIMKKKLLLF